MTFRTPFDRYDWNHVKALIDQQTPGDVERALAHDERDLFDFLALISPAAEPYLDALMRLSHEQTVLHFGKRIRMYAPLYLSNFCDNGCVYCGYRIDNAIQRLALDEKQIRTEMQVLRDYGFRHILLVTGESKRHADVDYFIRAMEIVRSFFPAISLEVQPLRQEEYARLGEYGLNGVYIYQETYRREHYRNYHPKGMKSHFYYRLETPDRIASAGIGKIGLGILIGLEDWRTDSYFVALHLRHLEETYPSLRRSVSFPRLRPAEGIIQPNVTITDRQLLQLICAYRLLSPTLEMSLSTRESAAFRDEAFAYGVTSMSAGSKTNPGGYALYPASLEQFEISDERPPAAIAEKLAAHGYEAVWEETELEKHQ